jgi:cytoskeletal protein CcmA (bactofilin family)
MKGTLKNLSFVLLLVVLALSLTAFKQADLSLQGSGDRLVLGGNYTLQEGETLDGNLIVMGGNATLEPGSRVEKDVVILGGNLLVEGVVGGDVNVIGGLVTLEEGAVVEGDVNTVSGQLLQDEGAVVQGDVNNDLMTLPFVFSAPARITIPNFNGELPMPFSAPNPLEMGVGLLGGVLWWLGRSFIWAVLALLVGLFIPRNTQRAAAAAAAKPVVAGGLGCMTVLVAPALLILLFITICGIPFSLLGMLLLLAAWAFGIIALGLETGKRLADLLKQDWALPVSAMIGTFVLTLLVNGLGALIPCVGWIVPALVGMVGLGAALVTRFGAQALPETQVLAPAAAGTQVVETIPLPSAPLEESLPDLPAVDTPPPDEQE